MIKSLSILGTSVAMLTSFTAVAALTNQDHNVHTEPDASKPGYLSSFHDGTYNSPIVRISGEPNTNIVTASGAVIGTWGNLVRPVYSLTQAFSTDESTVVLYNSGTYASGTWVLVSTTSPYKPTRILCPNAGLWDWRWSGLQTNSGHEIIVNVDQTGTHVQRIDSTTCTMLSNYRLQDSLGNKVTSSPNGNGTFGNGKGNLADNGTTMAVTFIDANLHTWVQVFEDDGRFVGPALDITNCGLSNCSVHDVTISHDKQYVIIGYINDHQQVLDFNTGTYVLTPHNYTWQSFTRNGSALSCGEGSSASNGFLVASVGHKDWMCAGDPCSSSVPASQEMVAGIAECPVQFDKYSDGSFVSNLIGVHLNDGNVFNLGSELTNAGDAVPQLISATNINDAQNVTVSYFCQDTSTALGCGGSNSYSHGYPYSGEILTMPTDGSSSGSEWARLAHHHSSMNCGYETNVFASQSWAGSYIVFSSDWKQHDGSTTSCPATNVISAYLLTTP